MGAEATPPGCPVPPMNSRLHEVSTLRPAAGSRGPGMKRGSTMRLPFLRCEARCVLGISGLVRDTGRVRRGPLRRRREGKTASNARPLQAERGPELSGQRALPFRPALPCPPRAAGWGVQPPEDPGVSAAPPLCPLGVARGPTSARGLRSRTVKAHGHQDGLQHRGPSLSLRQCMSGFALVSGGGRSETPRSFCEQPSSRRAAVPGSGLGWSVPALGPLIMQMRRSAINYSSPPPPC